MEPHRRWPTDRIEKELQKFLAGRRIWPTYLDFAKSGRARLHAQAMRWGGPYYWGPRFGVRVPDKSVRWSPEIVACALEPFLKGREQWPLKVDFDAAGLSALYYAARYYGGLTSWAKMFDLESPRTSWTQGRIERALTDLMDERGAFPTRAELQATGLGGLYKALCQHGGIGYWKRKMGVAMADAPAVALAIARDGRRAASQPARSSDHAALQRLRHDWLAPLLSSEPRWAIRQSGED